MCRGRGGRTNFNSSRKMKRWGEKLGGEGVEESILGKENVRKIKTMKRGWRNHQDKTKK